MMMMMMRNDKWWWLMFSCKHQVYIDHWFLKLDVSLCLYNGGSCWKVGHYEVLFVYIEGETSFDLHTDMFAFSDSMTLLDNWITMPIPCGMCVCVSMLYELMPNLRCLPGLYFIYVTFHLGPRLEERCKTLYFLMLMKVSFGGSLV